jgi:hypothetical protein
LSPDSRSLVCRRQVLLHDDIISCFAGSPFTNELTLLLLSLLPTSKLPIIIRLTTRRLMSSSHITHPPDFCASNTPIWTSEVLQREAGLPATNWAGAINPRVCTKDDWNEVWPKTHGDWHPDFDERHLSIARVIDAGDVEVQIPWRTKRGANRAGGPGHCK